MVDANTNVNINFQANAKQLKAANDIIKETGREIKNLNKVSAQATKDFESVGSVLQQAGVKGKQAFSFLELGLDNAGGAFKKVQKESFEFDGRLLSILFLGQALQKTFTRALKSIFKTFREATDNSLEFNQKVNQLSAAWEFLKFSIVDALSQSPLFLAFIDFITNLVDAISRFVGENPGIAKAIALFLALGAVLGGILFLTGQLALGFGALFGKGGFLTAATFTALTSKITAAANALTAFALANPILAVVIALLLIGAAAIARYPGLGEQFTDVWKDVGKEIQKTLAFIFSLFGVSVDLGDEWRFLGAVLVFLTQVVGVFISVFITGLAGVVVVIGTIVTLLVNSVAQGIKNLIDGLIFIIDLANKASNALGFGDVFDTGGLERASEVLERGIGANIDQIGKDWEGLINNATPIDELLGNIQSPKEIFDESKRLEAEAARAEQQATTQETGATTTESQQITVVNNFDGGFSPESIADGVEGATRAVQEGVERAVGPGTLSSIGG